MYVDDACLFDKTSILQAKANITQLFKVKDVSPLQEYIGVIVEYSNQDKLMLSQLSITARLKQYFGKEVSVFKKYRTPLSQNFHIVCPEEGTNTLSTAYMLKY